jgi:hypothetical protein
MGTSVRVTSQGSPYGRFRRALDRRQPTAALSAAAELPQVALTDALELLLLLRDADRPRFERAALRWHGRYCRELPDVGLREATAVLALLAGLGDRTPEAAARALAEILSGRNLQQPARVLIRWADTGIGGRRAAKE